MRSKNVSVKWWRRPPNICCQSGQRSKRLAGGPNTCLHTVCVATQLSGLLPCWHSSSIMARYHWPATSSLSRCSSHTAVQESHLMSVVCSSVSLWQQTAAEELNVSDSLSLSLSASVTSARMRLTVNLNGIGCCLSFLQRCLMKKPLGHSCPIGS